MAKKDEAAHYEGFADAVLTFDELTQWLKEENITLSGEDARTEESRARFFPTTGGILKTLVKQNPHYTYMAIDGTENCMAALEDIESGKIHRCFIEMSACVGSCVGGPVMEKFHRSVVKDYMVGRPLCRGAGILTLAQPDPAGSAASSSTWIARLGPDPQRGRDHRAAAPDGQNQAGRRAQLRLLRVQHLP